MQMTPNPYRWNKVNIALFYGREPLRHELVNGLRNGQSYGITGGRRMGKSTLLRRVEADLMEHAPLWAEGGLLVIPVYVDGLALSTPITPDTIFSMILGRIEERIAPEESLPINSYLPQSPIHPFAAQLAKLIRSSPRHFPQIIVLFDEVEPILASDWGRNFFANWRALLNNEPTVSSHVSAAFAGASEMFQLARDVGSPLGNILSWKELALFTIKDTDLLVNDPTNRRLGPELTERVFQETGGHPALIQYLMKVVCDHDLDEANQSIELAVDLFQSEERDKFEKWWEKLLPVAQQLYAHIHQAQTPLSRHFLSQSFNGIDTNRALDTLRHTGIVSYDSEQDSYAVAGQMFPQWYGGHAVVQTTPELPEQVDRLLKNVERSFRNLLRTHLHTKYGDDWLNGYISKIPTKTRNGSGSLLDAWCVTAKRTPGDLGPEEALLYAELSDLFMLISKEWGDLKGYFQFGRDPSKHKVLFDDRKDCLLSVRNALRHVREETVNTTELVKAQVFCMELLDRLS